MPAIARLLAAAAVIGAAPAAAVGLGPLTKSGLTDGERKAFYLTLINPYRVATTFRAYAIGYDDETAEPRVRIVPDVAKLGGESNRKLLVIADHIAPGESLSFRVCAERVETNQEILNARVCSKLVARRLRGRS